MAQVLRQVLRIGLKTIWVGEQPVVKLSAVALKRKRHFKKGGTGAGRSHQQSRLIKACMLLAGVVRAKPVFQPN